MISLRRHRSSENRSAQQRGVALVITLSALVLLTTLLLAFFSRAMLNRRISYSSANQTKAELLARSALDIVVGELRQEISDGSTLSAPVTGGASYYLPLDSTPTVNYSVPQKNGVSNADSATGAFTIVKNASTSTGLYPSSTRLFGSSIRIDQASINGRKESNWYSTGPGLGSADLPTWVYLTRGNSAVADPPLAQALDPAHRNYVMGRFTYTVYDTSGLLDANVAGFPSASSGLTYSISSTLSGSKTSIAYADLTVLGLSAPQVGTLVSWRTPTSGDSAESFDEWATGIPRTSGTSNSSAINAARSGHLSLPAGDQTFLNRRDLLHFASAQGWSSAPTQYLTHFSRANTGPTWKPTLNAGGSYNYKTDADQGTSANRNLLGACYQTAGSVTHYRDDGTTESIEIEAGGPVVFRRFSLAKLAWIGTNGPNDAAFDSSLSATDKTDAIKACFGLVWNSTELRWDYNTHWNASDHSIKTLKQIADEATPREPDFFELIKAVVLSGSLGKDPGKAANGPFLTYTGAPSDDVGVQGLDFESYSSARDLQIAQIGVNIIDQAGAGNFPTAVYLQTFQNKSPYTAVENKLFNTVFGIKNLPYLMQMGQLTAVTKDAAATGDIQEMSSWLQPEFWNPHQDLTANTYPSSSSTQYKSPGELRLVPYGRCYLMNIITAPVLTGSPVDFSSNPEAHALYFKNSANFFKSPVTLTETYQSSTFSTENNNIWNSWTSPVNFTGNKFLALYCGTVNRLKPAPDAGASNILINPDLPLTFVLEYYDGSRWRPYSLMSRVNVLLSQSLAKANPNGMSSSKAITARPDPRVDRFSVSASIAAGSAQWPLSNTIRKDNATQSFLVFAYPRPDSGFTYNTPLHPTKGDSSKANQTLYYEQWANNIQSNTTKSPYYTDPDGIVRPGDSYRADYATGNGALTFHGDVLTGTFPLRRPVILNRPFRSVAELGYVFRDLPFKSLDLWSDKSADAGLLDVFAVQDEPAFAAGQVNGNAAPKAVLKALFSSAGKTAADATQQLDSSTADTLGGSVAAYLSDPGKKLGNRADVVASLSGTIRTALTDVSYRNKACAETPVRALSGNLNMRTWNLLIDVTAQTGHLVKNAADLAAFNVEGEKRYWLHLAIDRLTNRIVSQQLEPVNE